MIARAIVAITLALVGCEPPVDTLLPRCTWGFDREFAANVQPLPGECGMLRATTARRYLGKGDAPEIWDVCDDRGGYGSSCIVVSHGEPYYVIGTGNHSADPIEGIWAQLDADGVCPLACE